MDIKSIKRGIFGTGNGDSPEEVEKDEKYYNTSKEEFVEENGIANSKMMLLEPRAYSEGQQIADFLKNRCAVVVNLKRVTPDVAKRIVDFLYGTIYAIDGSFEKLGGGVFLCTPNNVKVDGQISDDTAKSSRSKKEETEDDFF